MVALLSASRVVGGCYRPRRRNRLRDLPVLRRGTVAVLTWLAVPTVVRSPSLTRVSLQLIGNAVLKSYHLQLFARYFAHASALRVTT